MQQITLCNVRQNNLQIPRLTIPLKQVVIFCGPSGSGKSSLAIDTILAEGQRRCVEALRSSIRLDDRRLPRPAVESIEGLPPTFGMRQDLGERFNKHATLADLLGIQVLLEHLFLQKGHLHCPKTNHSMTTHSPQEASTHLLQHHEGAACHIVSKVDCAPDHYALILSELTRNGHTRIQYNSDFMLIEDAPRTPPKEFGVVLDRLKLRDSNSDRLKEGLKRGLSSRYQQVKAVVSSKSEDPTEIIFSTNPISPDGTRYSKPTWQHLQHKNALGCCTQCGGLGRIDSSNAPCQSCQSTGLGMYSTMLQIDGASFRDIMMHSAGDLLQWIDNRQYIGGEIEELKKTLNIVQEIGLTNPLYQKLNSLSTGERSRARICSVITQDLGDCLYILDEPSLGLDDTNVIRIINLLKAKVSQGQSFIVVDHHPLFHSSFDTIFHFGPGAGVHGGQILPIPASYDLLNPSEFQSKSFTAMKISDCPIALYNGALHVISGPSGSRKTTQLRVLHTQLTKHASERILLLSNLGSLGNKRSTLVTIGGMWSEIRSLMSSTKSAKLNRLKASDFSFNRKGGRCETCLGIGSIQHHVAPLPPTEVQCPDCLGKRFSDRTLQATYRDHTISQILNLTVDEALKIFEHQPSLYRQCMALQMVGLGYLTLGQTSPSLSGGEHRRIQLAQVLAPCLKPDYIREPLIVLMDDPTAALHASDAVKLQRCLLNFRRKDITMVLTSNNPQILDIADFITTLPTQEHPNSFPSS